jgi:hypothetical protein
MKMIRNILCLCSALIVVSALQAQTNPSAMPAVSARVVSVSDSSAVVVRGTASLPVVAGQFLREGDRIVTNSAAVTLVFANGSTAVLNPRTDLDLLTLRQDPYDKSLGAYGSLNRDPSQSYTRMRLNEGDVISNAKQLSSNSVFEVQTRIAVAGIRGTTFRVTLTRVGDTWTLRVTNVDGAVVIQSAALVGAGMVDGEAEVAEGDVIEMSGTIDPNTNAFVPSNPAAPITTTTLSAAGRQAIGAAITTANQQAAQQEPPPAAGPPEELERPDIPVPDQDAVISPHSPLN